MSKLNIIQMSVLTILVLLGGSARAATAYISTVDNMLYRFDTTQAPIDFVEVGVISGLTPTEVIIGIDFRPATGELYGVGDSDRLYVINTTTAAATAVNAAPFVPALDDSDRFGIDFDPVRDTLRVISESGQNLRIDPGTGTSVEDAVLLFGTNIGAIAYTDNAAGATVTTLFGLAPEGTMAGASDDFYRIGGIDSVPPADNGDTTFVNDVGFDLVEIAFDISDQGQALFLGQNILLPGITNLYEVDVTTGIGTFITASGGLDTLGGGRLTGLAIAPSLPRAVAVPVLTPVPLMLFVLMLGLIAIWYLNTLRIRK